MTLGSQVRIALEYYPGAHRGLRPETHQSDKMSSAAICMRPPRIFVAFPLISPVCSGAPNIACGGPPLISSHAQRQSRKPQYFADVISRITPAARIIASSNCMEHVNTTPVSHQQRAISVLLKWRIYSEHGVKLLKV